MNLRKSLSSLVPLSSLTLLICTLLSGGGASCGSDHACFYFTQVEYDISKSCPSRSEALTFFQGQFCETNITSVDNDGVFDGSTCCYEVTESNDFSTCGVSTGPVPPPFTATSIAVSSSGIGGMGGFGGAGGTGGTGGSSTCSTCAVFLTNTDPAPLCAGTSVSLYEAYSGCLCNGACASACQTDCSMNMSTPACDTCSIDGTNGCGKEHDACLADN